MVFWFYHSNKTFSIFSVWSWKVSRWQIFPKKVIYSKFELNCSTIVDFSVSWYLDFTSANKSGSLSNKNFFFWCQSSGFWTRYWILESNVNFGVSLPLRLALLQITFPMRYRTLFNSKHLILRARNLANTNILAMATQESHPQRITGQKLDFSILKKVPFFWVSFTNKSKKGPK